MTVDPVVVTPEMLSKKASVTLSSKSLKSNGKLENSGMTTHAPTVSRNIWRCLSACRFLPALRKHTRPIPKQILADLTNASQSGVLPNANKFTGSVIRKLSKIREQDQKKTQNLNDR